MRRIKVLCLVISFCLIGSFVCAETIILKSGKKIEGKIIERTEEYLKVDFQGVPLTYYLGEIENVDGEKVVLPSRANNHIQDAISEEQTSQDYRASEQQNIFEERLVESLMLNKEPELTEAVKARFDEAMTSLKKFSSEYPKSEFADDAEFFINYILFMGIVERAKKEGYTDRLKKDTEIIMEDMETIFKRYPDGTLEEFTLGKMKEVAGITTPEISIPYKYILPYMRGYVACSVTGDDKQIIENFSLIKDKLEYRDRLEQLIYLPLAVAYKRQGKIEELKSLAREAIDKFPENKRMLTAIEDFIRAIE